MRSACHAPRQATRRARCSAGDRGLTEAPRTPKCAADPRAEAARFFQTCGPSGWPLAVGPALARVGPRYPRWHSVLGPFPGIGWGASKFGVFLRAQLLCDLAPGAPGDLGDYMGPGDGPREMGTRGHARQSRHGSCMRGCRARWSIKKRWRFDPAGGSGHRPRESGPRRCGSAAPLIFACPPRRPRPSLSPDPPGAAKTDAPVHPLLQTANDADGNPAHVPTHQMRSSAGHADRPDICGGSSLDELPCSFGTRSEAQMSFAGPRPRPPNASGADFGATPAGIGGTDAPRHYRDFP